MMRAVHLRILVSSGPSTRGVALVCRELMRAEPGALGILEPESDGVAAKRALARGQTINKIVMSRITIRQDVAWALVNRTAQNHCPTLSYRTVSANGRGNYFGRVFSFWREPILMAGYSQ